MDHRARLLQRIGDINNFDLPRPLVSLEEFFEGNNDFGSIGYNFYPDQPSPAEFYQHFKSIRDRDDVSNVLVEVKDLEDPDGWPSTDTVWVLTTATPDELQSWLGDRFRADDILEGFPAHRPVEKVAIADNFVALCVWYD